MKIYNSYILIIAFVLLLTTIILIATGQNSLDIFFTVYIIEALVITELYVYFNTRARHGLTFISITLFGVFLFVVCLELINMLA